MRAAVPQQQSHAQVAVAVGGGGDSGRRDSRNGEKKEDDFKGSMAAGSGAGAGVVSSVRASLANMDRRKLYAGGTLLPLLVAHPVLTSLSRDPETGTFAYHPGVAVMLTEVLKLYCSAALFILGFGCVSPRSQSGYATWGEFGRKSLYFSVPAVVYAVGNNFVILSLNYLDPAVQQVLMNLKILSTAVLSWLLLEKKISALQWVALLVLTCGAAVTQIRTPCPECAATKGAEHLHGAKDAGVSTADEFFGITMVLLATLTSGIAGVWTEYVFKGRGGVVKEQPIQLQNMQLYFWGVCFHAAVVWYRSGEHIAENGLFAGFGFWAWASVLNQTLLGFAVSFLIKYADNIVKVFMNCVSMLLVAVLSSILLGNDVGIQLVISIVLVASSIYLYNTAS